MPVVLHSLFRIPPSTVYQLQAPRYFDRLVLLFLIYTTLLAGIPLSVCLSVITSLEHVIILKVKFVVAVHYLYNKLHGFTKRL